jgi:hypothetical protein
MPGKVNEHFLNEYRYDQADRWCGRDLGDYIGEGRGGSPGVMLLE